MVLCVFWAGKSLIFTNFNLLFGTMASFIPALSNIKSKQQQPNSFHSNSNGNGIKSTNRIPRIQSAQQQYSNATALKTKPSKLPPPQVMNSQNNNTHSHKAKSSNPTQLTIVYFGHREYEPLIGKTLDSEIISEIKFNKIVFVQSLRVVNLEGMHNCSQNRKIKKILALN